MNPEQKEKLEKKLLKIGLNAVLKAPKSKLYAKVNHEDNFSLAMYYEAHNAIMNEVCNHLDNLLYIEWLNEVTHTRTEKEKLFNAFIMGICRSAYKKLRK